MLESWGCDCCTHTEFGLDSHAASIPVRQQPYKVNYDKVSVFIWCKLYTRLIGLVATGAVQGAIQVVKQFRRGKISKAEAILEIQANLQLLTQIQQSQNLR